MATGFQFAGEHRVLASIHRVFSLGFKSDSEGRLILGWGRPTERNTTLDDLIAGWIEFRDYIMEGGVGFQVHLSPSGSDETIFEFRSNDPVRGMYVGAATRAYLIEAGLDVATAELGAEQADAGKPDPAAS